MDSTKRPMGHREEYEACEDLALSTAQLEAYKRNGYEENS